MTRRGWYVTALVSAVLVLVLSIGAVVAGLAHRGTSWGSAQVSSSEGWRQGLAGPGMHRRGGGMMGDWGDEAGAAVSADQATATAKAWVAAHEPGATVGNAVRMPMGYVFTVTRDSQVLGTIMVNDDTGQLVWMGTVQPSPSTSAS